MTVLKSGSCRNATLDADGSVLVECPHGGTAMFFALPASLAAGMGMRELRGLCEGCIADADAEEADRELERRRDRLAAVKDGPRDREWSFATFPRDEFGMEAWTAAQVWIDGWTSGTRSNLLTWGPVGTGKTGLAWCIVRELILKHGVDAQLVNWRNLLYDIRASFDLEPGQRRESLHRYFGAAVLFLDDVGAEKPTEWASEQLSIIVDERYMRQRVTCVTSNYKPSQLTVRLSPDGDTVVGQRIVSRLSEGATKLEIQGNDRRM